MFRDVNMTIANKSNIGVLGLNGAGKSTLIRLLGGSEFANKGSVDIQGSVSWPLGLSGGVQGSLSGRKMPNFRAQPRTIGERYKPKLAKPYAALGEKELDIKVVKNLQRLLDEGEQR